MASNFGNKLVIAISSRALFNLDDSHRVFETEGLERYQQYQIDHEDEILAPGEAFGMVNKLLAINDRLPGSRGLKCCCYRATAPTPACGCLTQSSTTVSILAVPLLVAEPALIAMSPPLAAICSYPPMQWMSGAHWKTGSPPLL